MTRGTGYSRHMVAGFDEHYGSGSVAMFFTIGGVIAGIVGSAVDAKCECWQAAREAAAVQAAVQAHLAQVAAAVFDDGEAVPWHGESEWMRVSGG